MNNILTRCDSSGVPEIVQSIRVGHVEIYEKNDNLNYAHFLGAVQIRFFDGNIIRYFDTSKYVRESLELPVHLRTEYIVEVLYREAKLIWAKRFKSKKG